MGGMLGGNAPRQFGYDGVSPLIDMINGGGAGRAGQRFEGGGLLSELGNALFRPYGFEERMGQVRPQARPMRPPMAPPAPAVDIHDVPPASLTYGPQNPRRAPQPMQPPMGGGRTAVGPQRLSAPLTYGPQNGRPFVGLGGSTIPQQQLLQQLLAELSNPNTPPARRAQIEQTLRAMPGLQGGGDILGYLGGL